MQFISRQRRTKKQMQEAQMEKEKMMKEHQQVKEEAKTEVQDQEKVDPLVKKKIVKVKVESFNFLPL